LSEFAFRLFQWSRHVGNSEANRQGISVVVAR
jgi:hypothetical protein